MAMTYTCGRCGERFDSWMEWAAHKVVCRAPL